MKAHNQPMKDWMIFAVLALVLWGFWGFFAKLATNYISPKSALVYETLGGLVVGIIVLIIIGFKLDFHTKGISFAFLAGFAAMVGALFFLYAVTKGKTALVVSLTALYPLVTVVLASLIIKEPLTIKEGFGILFALIAMVLFAI